MSYLNLSQIEQGIKAAIAALGRPYIASIETYGGEFDAGLSDVVRRFPAIWTTFGGAGKAIQVSARKFKRPLTFVTLVGAKSLRNEEATRHNIEDDNGQHFSVGTFQLLSDVERALLNNNLKRFGVLGVDPFELGKLEKVYDTKTKEAAISVFAQHWHTNFTVTKSAADWDVDADDAEWMQAVNINYFFKPQDDMKDSSDLVQLDN
ncbi:phage protein Gp37 [Acinetobacter tandoii]